MEYVCEHCAAPLGVYEPIVLVSDGAARDTSRAAEPALAADAGHWYHGACFAEISFVATAPGVTPPA